MDNLKFAESPKTKQKFFYGYIIVAAALLIVILDYGARLSFGVFFKPMLHEFDWTRSLTSGAFTLSMLFQGLGSMYLGRLNDKLGPRLVMTICGAFLGVGVLLMSQVGGAWQLYLFYGVLVGIGMGGAFVALLSTVARWFVKRRGMMTGIVIAGVGLGTLIIPPIASWLISIYNWRMSYVIVGSIVLVIGVLAAQLLRRDPTKMGLVPHGEQKVDEQRLGSGEQGFSLSEAIHTRQFWMIVIAYFCLGYCVFTINVHLVPTITDIGISATTAANVLAVSGALTAVGCMVLGSTIDRIGSRYVLLISFTMITASVLWLVGIKQVWMFYLYAVIYGLGSGGGAPAESTLTAELFGMKSHGAIFGFVSFCFTIGGAVGPFLTGYLFDVTSNYQLAFLITAASGAVGIIFTAILRPIKRQELKT
jgi:MFS family permease